MRTLAIGDIHGHIRALDALLCLVHPQTTDLIVTLGDYVDGGLDSAAVLDRLVGLSRSHRLIAIRGNHDQMMLNARTDSTEREMWCSLGGNATPASYPQASVDRIPDEHWQFLSDYCVNWYETETHIFVHAHVDPDLPLSQQTIVTLHWTSILYKPCLPHRSGKTVICGHLSQADGLPLNLGQTICIDTLKGAWLTCLDATSGTIWQASDDGRCRTSRLMA